MDEPIEAEHLSESDLDYILSLQEITARTLSLPTKRSFAQKILNSKNWKVTKNLKFNITDQVIFIKKTLVKVETLILKFNGIKYHPLYKKISNRLKFLYQIIQSFEIPKDSDLSYTIFINKCLAKYFNLKVIINMKICQKRNIPPTSNNNNVSLTLKETMLNTSFKFDDNFEYMGLLGEGGQGKVIEARHKVDESCYAVKIVPFKAQKAAKARREVKLLAELDHLNIIRYYFSWVEALDWKKEQKKNKSCSTASTSLSLDAKNDKSPKPNNTNNINNNEGDDSDGDNDSNNSNSNDNNQFLYIQMQLCDKENLRQWLKKNEDRSEDTVMDFFLQIVDALVYIHGNKIIHRDLKPDNIFFSLDGTIKVGDFGLAIDVGSLNDVCLHTKGLGTKIYMSPEQSSSGIYDFKTDIYALGIILFELLVHFSTNMERCVTLTALKKQEYPKGFAERYPLGFLLIQNMLSEDPTVRMTAKDIQDRIISFSENNNGEKYQEETDYEYSIASVVHQENFDEDSQKMM